MMATSTMQPAAGVPVEEPLDAPSSRWLVLGALVAGAIGLSWWTSSVATDLRASAVPSIVLVIVVWFLGVFGLSLRTPGGHIRVSEPCMWVMGWMGYYFIRPAISWVSGHRMLLEQSANVNMSPDAVTQVQYFHVLFIVAFVAAYHVLAPRFRVVPLGRTDALDAMPGPTGLMILGLVPLLIELVIRVGTSGSLSHSENYGASWVEIQDNIATSRAVGGGDYALTQVLAKVWFIPLMSLGIGNGLILTRLLKERRWLSLGLFHLQFPLLTFLGSGARSAVAMPFLVALVIADYLRGALPWRYILGVVLVGMAFFNFYGFYRGFQTEDFGSAVERSVDAQGEDSRNEIDRGEDSAMLVKEVYCVAWADSTGYESGATYFLEGVLALLPLQVVPEKVNWMSTANMLSREMLGRAAAYAGVAGTIIGDGYFIGRDIGIVVLAVVLGGILAITVKILVAPSPGATGPMFWKLALLGCFSAQTVYFIRNDLAGVLNQVVFNVAAPAAIFLVLSRGQQSGWFLPLRVEQ